MASKNKNLVGGRTENAKSNFGRKGWLMCLMCFLYYALMIAFDNGLNYIVPVFIGTFGWSQTTLFAFTSIGGWIAVVGLVVFGAYKRVKGNKKMLILTQIIFVVCLVVWAFAQNIVMYAIGAIGTKVAASAFVFLGVAGIAGNWFPTKKGIFMGWCTMGVTVGGMMANIVMPNALAKGPEVGLGIFAVLGLIVLVLTILLVKNNPEEAGAYPDNDKTMTPERVKAIMEAGETFKKTSSWTIQRSLKSGIVWQVGLLFGLFNFVAQGFMSQVTLAAEAFGHPADFAQFLLLIGGLLGFFSSYIGGVFDQKMGTKIATVICMVALAVGLFIGGFAGQLTAGIALVTFIVSMATSYGNNMLVSMSSTLWGRYDMDAPYQILIIVQQVVSSFGYMAMSGLAESSGGYKVPFMVFGAVAVVVVILTATLKDKFLGRTEEEMLASKG